MSLLEAHFLAAVASLQGQWCGAFSEEGQRPLELREPKFLVRRQDTRLVRQAGAVPCGRRWLC